jgi:hypothetical protein
MEQEGVDPYPHYYYTGNGQFYNTQMVRSLSEVGQTGTSGPGGGPAGNAIAPPSGGGGVPDAALDAGIADAASNASQLGVYFGLEALGDVKLAAPLLPAGPVPTIIAAAALALFDIFDAIFGGGSDTPVIPRQLRHNRHPLYPVILGVSDGLIPDEAPSGNPQFCGDPSGDAAKELIRLPL